MNRTEPHIRYHAHYRAEAIKLLEGLGMSHGTITRDENKLPWIRVFAPEGKHYQWSRRWDFENWYWAWLFVSRLKSVYFSKIYGWCDSCPAEPAFKHGYCRDCYEKIDHNSRDYPDSEEE